MYKIQFIICILFPLFLASSCKEDKKIPVEESILIDGNKAPLLGIDMTEIPVESDNGNYLKAGVNESVTISYEGIEKNTITWEIDGETASTSDQLSFTYQWDSPGMKTVKAILENGEERTAFVWVTSAEPSETFQQNETKQPITNKPEPIVSKPEPKPVVKPITDSNTSPEPNKNQKPDLRADKDDDGVPDHLDNCPELPGDRENKGCPWPDTDNDGVPDHKDKCKNEKGTAANSGCPVVEIPEFEKTGNAGISNTSCMGGKNIKTSSSINITPKKMAELAYVKVAAETTCTANITISANDGQKAIQMRNRQLNGGSINEINFQHLGYILKPGVVYTITLAPGDDNFSVSDLSECNSGNGSNDILSISYNGGHKVLFALVYKY